MIGDPTTLPLVREALRDAEWWVRLRAGLALTRMGTTGRNGLLEAEVGADPDARDMARLILGLSPQALAELAALARRATPPASRSWAVFLRATRLTPRRL